MRSIQDYINEALISKSNIGNIVNDTEELFADKPVNKFKNSSIRISWPTDEKCTTWAPIELKKPNKFVVYYDKYHRCNHIASFGGYLESYIMTGSFEDFTPDTLIKGFDTLKDAVEYAVKDADPDEDDWNETSDIYSTNSQSPGQLPGYYDDMCFCKAVLAGNEKEKDYEDITEFKMFDIPAKKRIMNAMNYIY